MGDCQARGGAMADDEEEDAIESEYAAQRARIVAMREEGFTLEEIGEETDLTPEAVLDILRKEDMQ
jgi:DNA-directed RNA polymerase specialized sigma24 family protein